MARLRRLVVGRLPHCLALFGHNRQPIVLDETDRQQLLGLLLDVTRTHRLEVHAWALLPEQLHLLATPPTDRALSAAMQSLARRHAAAFNRRHGRSGTLWAGRFNASVLQPGAAVGRAMLFIETLGEAQTPQALACAPLLSSRAHHLGQVRDPLIAESPFWWALGNTPFDREAAWALALDKGLRPDEAQALQAALRRGWPQGDARFLQSLQVQTGQAVRPRPRGRPRRAGAPAPAAAAA